MDINQIIDRYKSKIFRILVIIYILAVIASGYWYWMRPVRRSQIHSSHRWWSSIAQDFHLPVPPTENWE